MFFQLCFSSDKKIITASWIGILTKSACYNHAMKKLKFEQFEKITILSKNDQKVHFKAKKAEKVPILSISRPAKGIFYHIADDPIRSKKLRGRGDAFFRYLDVLLELLKGIVLELGVIVLVHPADDLHGVLPVIFGDHRDHSAKYAILPQKVCQEKQLSPVRNLLKHDRQRFAQGVALRYDKIFDIIFL